LESLQQSTSSSPSPSLSMTTITTTINNNNNDDTISSSSSPSSSSYWKGEKPCTSCSKWIEIPSNFFSSLNQSIRCQSCGQMNSLLPSSSSITTKTISTISTISTTTTSSYQHENIQGSQSANYKYDFM